MEKIYYEYNYRGDTTLEFRKTDDRAEIELIYEDEDPDCGTDILVLGGDADKTMLSLCREQLKDIKEFLDKTDNGCLRNIDGYEELNNLSNSTLIAFEHILERFCNLIDMIVYCDTTDLYSEEECVIENLTHLEFPEILLQNYMDYDSDEEFWRWYHDESTADDTEGLYEYCKARGFKAQRG